MSSFAFGNGFKIQEQSLNATALSSAYVAGAGGADASYYNPANMGFKNDWGENKSEFEIATSLITIPGFKFNVPTTNQGLRSKTVVQLKGLASVAGSQTVNIDHMDPDPQVVFGSTEVTNFILPKFFYKSRTHNGLTFGASFIAPSGLAMNWADKGGEFLQDVFIMMIEFAPSVSYTIGDRFSVGFAPRFLYAMGSFNNVVYVPMRWKDGQKPAGTGSTCTDSVNSCIELTGSDFDKLGSNNDERLAALQATGLMTSSQVTMLKGLLDAGNVTGGLFGTLPKSLKDVIATSTTTMYGSSKVYQKSQGKAVSAGYRLSASLRVFDNGMFSVVYNSPVKFNMKGDLSATTYIGGTIGNVLTETTLDIAVTVPEILSVAYAQTFFKNHLRIEGVYERTFWSRGSKFLVTPDFANATYTGLSGLVANKGLFTNKKLASMVGLADFAGVMNMGAGWRDTNTYRLGVTYMGKALRLMGSLAYDEAPSPQDKIGIPDSDGYMIGVGAKYNFRGFDLGIAYSVTFKDNRRSMYQSDGLGQLKIATMSLGYRW
nr:outer membrane protein transport protein [Helicobacter sp. 11S03491-1]